MAGGTIPVYVSKQTHTPVGLEFAGRVWAGQGSSDGQRLGEDKWEIKFGRVPEGRLEQGGWNSSERPDQQILRTHGLRGGEEVALGPPYFPLSRDTK